MFNLIRKLFRCGIGDGSHGSSHRSSKHHLDGGYELLLSGWGLSCYNTEAWHCTIIGKASRTRYNYIHHTRRLSRLLAIKKHIVPNIY